MKRKAKWPKEAPVFLYANKYIVEGHGPWERFAGSSAEAGYWGIFGRFAEEGMGQVGLWSYDWIFASGFIPLTPAARAMLAIARSK